MSSDRTNQIIKILSLVQSWHISTSKALNLLSDVFEEKTIEYPSQAENSVFDPNEWEAVVVDEITRDWPNTVKYSFSSVRSGDKVLLLRKKVI